MEQDILIKGDNLSIGYGGYTVQSSIAFQISAGECFFVVGPNGSGKTTFIKTILGLLPSISGELSFLNKEIKSQIGYMPQQNELQKNFPTTVKEVVLSGFLNHMKHRPFYIKEEKARAKDILLDLQISELYDRCYGELSGGQQQRVRLARALCAGERVLVLDEPAAAMDPVAAIAFYQLIQFISKKEKKAVIMVTHDIEKIVDVEGKVLYVGEPSTLFDTVAEFLDSKQGKEMGKCN